MTWPSNGRCAPDLPGEGDRWRLGPVPPLAARAANRQLNCAATPWQIVVPPAASHDPADFQSPDGAFSPKGNNIAVLQRRGVVFLACHNAIWELAERLIAENQNPDHLAIDALASDLTNHLIPDAVLTPGVVPTMVKLRTVGFVYTR